MLGGACLGVADLAVGARLDELDVVVGERPKEGLGALERPCVVVAVEGTCGIVDQSGEAGQERAIDGGGDD